MTHAIIMDVYTRLENSNREIRILLLNPSEYPKSTHQNRSLLLAILVPGLLSSITLICEQHSGHPVLSVEVAVVSTLTLGSGSDRDRGGEILTTQRKPRYSCTVKHVAIITQNRFHICQDRQFLISV